MISGQNVNDRMPLPKTPIQKTVAFHTVCGLWSVTSILSRYSLWHLDRIPQPMKQVSVCPTELVAATVSRMTQLSVQIKSFSTPWAKITLIIIENFDCCHTLSHSIHCPLLRMACLVVGLLQPTHIYTQLGWTHQYPWQNYRVSSNTRVICFAYTSGIHFVSVLSQWAQNLITRLTKVEQLCKLSLQSQILTAAISFLHPLHTGHIDNTHPHGSQQTACAQGK